MQPAEARRQEVIDPGDEGDAGDGAEPGAGAAEAGDDGEARRERGHPPEPEPVADVIDRLHDAVQCAGLLIGDRDQHGERPGDIDEQDERSGECERLRHGAARILYLAAHQAR